MTTNALSKVGEKRLATFEVVIEKGLGTFLEVGGALQAIREERLYRVEHESFDDYLKVRWKMSRTYAHRLIAAAEIAGALPIGNKPETESQARALAPLKDDPAAMAEVMEAASANGNPTAEVIKAEVVKRTSKREALNEAMVDTHPAKVLVARFDQSRKLWFDKVTVYDPAEVADAYVHEGHSSSVHDLVTSLRSYADRLEARLREATKLKGVQ